jgi:regulator of replication initiation timing
MEQEEQILKAIEKLKSQLTGNLLEDGDLQMEIYKLKKLLNPRIEEHPEEDNDEGCLNCGS